MTQRKITLIIVFVLLVASLYFYFSNKTGTLTKELKDFAVQDTGSITKIFLADKSNNAVTLIRHEDYWTVNNKYECRKDAIDLLLKTIRQIMVKSTVPSAAHNTVIKNMAGKSVKTEIYQGDKLVKVYYVGYATQDQEGTYMLLENSKEPFITYIPGFRGFLSPRYFTDEDLWRVNTIFKYKFNEIKSVSLVNMEVPGKSFEVFNNGNNTYSLKSFVTDKVIPGFDTLKVKDYISHFKKLNYELPVNAYSKTRIDSLLSSKPAYILTVNDIHSKSKTIKIYRRKDEEGDVDDYGKPLEFDKERMLTFLDNNRFLVTIQTFVFDPVLLDPEDFFKGSNNHKIIH